jgi:hypothetical protein
MEMLFSFLFFFFFVFFLFFFFFGYAITKVQQNQIGLKLSGIHQLLVYADAVSLLGNKTGAMEKNTVTLIDASKEVGLHTYIYFTFHKPKIL